MAGIGPQAMSHANRRDEASMPGLAVTAHAAAGYFVEKTCSYRYG
jgi:hypothetical protein